MLDGGHGKASGTAFYFTALLALWQCIAVNMFRGCVGWWRWQSTGSAASWQMIWDWEHPSGQHGLSGILSDDMELLGRGCAEPGEFLGSNALH
eukprot:661583-Pelagomonas_calceolata.AAC.3